MVDWTTSFRVSQLNYKIERQLQLLKLFWNENTNTNWKSNKEIRSKYCYFIRDNKFLIDETNRPDKDAREKNWVLVDIGVLTQYRKLTGVGMKIESLLEKEGITKRLTSLYEDKYNEVVTTDTYKELTKPYEEKLKEINLSIDNNQMRKYEVNCKLNELPDYTKKQKNY